MYVSIKLKNTYTVFNPLYAYLTQPPMYVAARKQQVKAKQLSVCLVTVFISFLYAYAVIRD